MQFLKDSGDKDDTSSCKSLIYYILQPRTAANCPSKFSSLAIERYYSATVESLDRLARRIYFWIMSLKFSEPPYPYLTSGKSFTMCSTPAFSDVSPTTTAYSPLVPTSRQLCGSPFLTILPHSSAEVNFYLF